METELILKIIKESFDNNISCDSADTILGKETWIDGFDDFVNEIKDKLNK